MFSGQCWYLEKLEILGNVAQIILKEFQGREIW